MTIVKDQPTTDRQAPAWRIEKDSMGEIKVPASALYSAQTQRAVENFPVSGITFSRAFVRAAALIKKASAEVNRDLGRLDTGKAGFIVQAADEVAAGKWDDQFPIDIYQTGSGTSTNMNINEVIATRAVQIAGGLKIHPNDDVNMGQSSNDVIPAAIHVSGWLETTNHLLPALRHLAEALEKKGREGRDIVKTGRTHLMDAMPVTVEQEFGGYAAQVRHGVERVEGSLARVARLAIGGTAVGTGVNTHPEFGARVAGKLNQYTGATFSEADDHFAAQGSMDSAAELSAQLKTTASALMKIANDLRWMNSGPIAGLGEISLPSLQPGSSIMPGKVNPVICESLMMVCAQVIGNDLAVTIGNERGNFELNVMLPLIAHNLLQSIHLLANASRMFADKAVAGLTINAERMAESVEKNPILVTALNPVIGYDKAAQIAKKAFAEGRRLHEVAAEMTDLKPEELKELLDPRRMIKPS